jgi:hypothetical protein
VTDKRYRDFSCFPQCAINFSQVLKFNYPYLSAVNYSGYLKLKSFPLCHLLSAVIAIDGTENNGFSE